MARKSGWQQFSDNFGAVYGTFQKFAGDLESKNIMDEEVEILTADDGTQSWNYGGKSYDKEITPSMLRGLQYDSMATSMAKYGDPKGAMDMRLRASELRENRRKNDLRDAQFDALVAQVGLKNANIIAQTENVGANTGNTRSQTTSRDAMLPGKLDTQDANAANIRSQTTARNAKLPGEVDIQKLAIAEGGIKNETSKLTLIERQALSESKVNKGIAQNKSDGAAAEVAYAANSTLVEYSTKLKAGAFKKPGSGKAWLLENWTGDPETAKRIKAMDEMQINQTLNEGAQLMSKVENALTGTQGEAMPSILQLIDEQDSIPNNVQIIDTDGQFIRMVQTDENGENPIVIAEGEDWNEFKQNLIGTMTPMKSIEISTANAKVANLEADTGLKKGQTKDIEGKALRVLAENKLKHRVAYMSSTAYSNLIALPNATEADVLRSYERWVEDGMTTPGVNSASGFTVERDD